MPLARTVLLMSLVLVGFVQIARPAVAAPLDEPDEPLVEEEIDPFSGVEVISVVGETPDRNFDNLCNPPWNAGSFLFKKIKK